ncbi:hypothetical protein B0H16DRAFT_1526052 [Mycena metata]|uniref:F-box domain-containing protein n=1 Tax=Mycena metata TaxID=1033252 RepID=A0AAD7NL23_9AGAR|nr:hypothetical protein B0H16DRAFT_1526052 [Mycena metata]
MGGEGANSSISEKKRPASFLGSNEPTTLGVDFARALNQLARIELQDDAPIRSLPQDLLYELLIILTSEPSLDGFDLALCLSHVCHDWRAVVVHSPLFWRFIPIPSSGSSPNHAATTESFLRRSGDQTITVAVFLRKASSSISDITCAALHNHTPRVRSLWVFTSDVPTLSSHLRHLSAVSFPSLKDHRAVIQSESSRFTAVSCLSQPRNPHAQILLLEGVPTWPPHLHVTTLSFSSCSFSPIDTFLIVSMARATLQHLKLYLHPQTPVYMHDITGSAIELPALRSLWLGFHDPLAPVPFLWRARLPALESLSVEDLRPLDTKRSKPCVSPSEFSGLQQVLGDIDPMCMLFTVLMRAITGSVGTNMLTSLRLVRLTYPSDIAASLFSPHLCVLHLSHCEPVFLRGLVAALMGPSMWSLERLSVAGETNSGLLLFLTIRKEKGHARLKELTLGTDMVTLPGWPEVSSGRAVYEDFTEDLVLGGPGCVVDPFVDTV